MKLTEIGITTIQELPGEDWVYVCQTNNRYLISNKGRLLTMSSRHITSGKIAIMKPALDAHGYLRTMIKKSDGKFHTIKMHRLTLIHFKENPNNYPQVNHIDFNRANNDIDNLEWVSPKQNYTHSKDNMHGGWTKENQPKNKPFGERMALAKLTDQAVRDIRARFKPRKVTREMLGKEYGVAPSVIKDVILFKTWKHVV